VAGSDCWMRFSAQQAVMLATMARHTRSIRMALIIIRPPSTDRAPTHERPRDGGDPIHGLLLQDRTAHQRPHAVQNAPHAAHHSTSTDHPQPTRIPDPHTNDTPCVPTSAWRTPNHQDRSGAALASVPEKKGQRLGRPRHEEENFLAHQSAAHDARERGACTRYTHPVRSQREHSPLRSAYG
jgi:hypothetical protein